MRISVYLTIFILLIPAAALGTIWSDCSAHVCTSVGCSVPAIEAFENGNKCANWGWSGGNPTVPASGTVCERGETLGTKDVVSYLNCAGGDCAISGKFKCPQPSGGYGAREVDLTCPSRNLGGTVYSPAVTITSEYYPELGASGTAGYCTYPDGMIFANCDASGNVGYGTTF